MKIGDRVLVHGYIDEIRKDTVIIRNNGGYFGTIPSEVITGELPSAQSERKKGGWRDHQEGDWIYAKCSLCGAVQDSRSNFCPNCGAEMEGEEESE